jgi:hypothetical protein
MQRRTATDMLAVKTLSDAIEVNAGHPQLLMRSLVVRPSSQNSTRLAAEASQTILTQMGKAGLAAGFVLKTEDRSLLFDFSQNDRI